MSSSSVMEVPLKAICVFLIFYDMSVFLLLPFFWSIKFCVFYIMKCHFYLLTRKNAFGDFGDWNLSAQNPSSSIKEDGQVRKGGDEKGDGIKG